MSNIERVGDGRVQAERDRAAGGPVSDLVSGGLSLDLAHAICERNVGWLSVRPVSVIPSWKPKQGGLPRRRT